MVRTTLLSSHDISTAWSSQAGFSTAQIADSPWHTFPHHLLEMVLMAQIPNAFIRNLETDQPGFFEYAKITIGVAREFKPKLF